MLKSRDAQKALKKVVKLLFNGDSAISLAAYAIIFYLIAFYALIPAVYAFTPVNYISSVISTSMDHSSSLIKLTYYDWLGINGLANASKMWPFQSGISLGSMVIAYKTPPSQIAVGDVIIYHAIYMGQTEEIIHRVINETVINGTYYYTTKGDANAAPLQFEYNVPYSSVIGKVGIAVPYLGYPRYILYLFQSMI